MIPATFQPEEDPTFIKRCRATAKANHIRSTKKLHNLVESGIPSFQYSSDINSKMISSLLSVSTPLSSPLFDITIAMLFLLKQQRIGGSGSRVAAVSLKPRWLQLKREEEPPTLRSSLQLLLRLFLHQSRPHLTTFFLRG